MNICPVHGKAVVKNTNTPKWVALLSKEYNEYYYVNVRTGETVWVLPMDVQPSDVGTAAQFKINPSFKEDVLCTCEQAYIIEKTAEEIKMDSQPNKITKHIKNAHDDSRIRNIQSANPRKNKAISRRQSLPAGMKSVDDDDDDKVKKNNNIKKNNEEENRIVMERQIKNTLKNGAVFLKHGTHRKPHWKFVYLNDDDEIQWVDLKSKMKIKSKNNKNNKKAIKVTNIIQILEGKRTPVLKHKRCQKIENEFCFSIMCPERSLDLQAPTVTIRDEWVNNLAIYVEKLQTKPQLPIIHPTSTPPQQIDQINQLQINHKKFLRTADQQSRQERIGFRRRETAKNGPNGSQTSRIPRSKSLVRKRIKR